MAVTMWDDKLVVSRWPAPDEWLKKSMQRYRIPAESSRFIDSKLHEQIMYCVSRLPLRLVQVSHLAGA
jgi:hypothetical protein